MLQIWNIYEEILRPKITTDNILKHHKDIDCVSQWNETAHCWEGEGIMAAISLANILSMPRNNLTR